VEPELLALGGLGEDLLHQALGRALPLVAQLEDVLHIVGDPLALEHAGRLRETRDQAEPVAIRVQLSILLGQAVIVVRQ
jgi:hypothetical protein